MISCDCLMIILIDCFDSIITISGILGIFIVVYISLKVVLISSIIQINLHTFII